MPGGFVRSLNDVEPGDWLSDLYMDEMIESAEAFRCDRCDTRFPVSLKVTQDGLKLCRVRCLDSMGELDMAEDKARTATWAASRHERSQGENATASPFEGAVGITDISPSPLSLTVGGATGDLTITGVNLSSEDAFSFQSGSGLTGTASYLDGVATLTVDPAAATAGDWFFIYAGSRFSGYLRVR